MSEAEAKEFTGRAEILAYFRRLLARYPDWVWTNTQARPLDGGFLNHWHAVIPDGDRVVECDGVCTVTIEDGLIRRNEVFFDRTPLLLETGRKGAVSFSLLGAGTAYAVQTHMFDARDDLQNALNELQQAIPDKGGHRVQAIDLVNQAIDQAKPRCPGRRAIVPFNRYAGRSISATAAMASGAPLGRGSTGPGERPQSMRVRAAG